MDDLEVKLSWLDMSQYLERFLQAGFDSWETVLEITEGDLDVLDVELGHRRKLQREIANTRKLARDPAYVARLYPSLYGPESPQLDSGHRSSGYDTLAAGQGKRSYRHHPKPDPNAPKRPYSAYVEFSNSMREDLEKQSLSFAEISKRVGDSWQALAPEEKERWKQRAAEPWEIYKAELTAYQQSDGHRQYLQYLEQFKREQAVKKGEMSQQRNELSQSNSPTTSNQAKMRRFGTPLSPRSEIKTESPKIAIGRVRKNSNRTASLGGSHGQRISHACESCRQKKTKCPGERPVCQNCKNLCVRCVYADGKRDLKKKLMANLWEKVAAYEALLLQFIPQVDDEDQSAIQKCLLMPPQLDHLKEPRSLSQSPASDQRDEDTVSGVGSMGSTDITNENDFTNHGTAKRTQAFIGQASEERWLQRLERELSDSLSPDTENYVTSQAGLAVDGVSPQPSKTSLLPLPEDMDTSVIGNQIDLYGLPVKKTADALINAYFTTIHPSFPIVNKAYFYRQFEEYYTTVESESFKDRAFLPILQTVFALGAVHAHRVGAEWAGDERDHVLYLARARMLSMDMGILNEYVYHGQVQVFGLAGMYFLAINQINRAWSTVGLAIRCAQALGMHLQNITPDLTDMDKDFRVCIWHAVVSLEQTIAGMTGRPSMIHDQDCSVSLPRLKLKDGTIVHIQRPDKPGKTSSVDFAYQNTNSLASGPALGVVEDRPNLSVNISTTTAYFRYFVQLNTLAHTALTGLYSPEVKRLKWATIQKRISKLDQKLLNWTSTLPMEFDVQTKKTDPEPLQAALGTLFYSTRSMINRPTLCRLEQHIPNQSKSSVEFNRVSAKKCVNSARAILDFLPDRPDAQSCHSSPMWWMLHHHLRRAGTVLLLELAFRGHHMPLETEQVLVSAKKAVNWLRIMAANSNPAKQSWMTLSRLLGPAAHRIDKSIIGAVSHHQPHLMAATDGEPLPATGLQFQSYGAAAVDAWQPLNEYNHDLQSQTPIFGDLDMSQVGHFGLFQDNEFGNMPPVQDGVEDQSMSDDAVDTAQDIDLERRQ